MPKPKITEPEQIALSVDGKVKAKRLVAVAKTYRMVPDFYGKALQAAADKKSREKE